MTSRLERFIFALVIALVMAGATLVIASAQEGTPQQPATPMTSNDCATCHSDVYDAWQKGPHSQSLTSEKFQALWGEQGKPGACLVCHTTGYDPASGTSKADSVACEACHNPIPSNHPMDNMPVDKSPDLCSTCHSDPNFVVENWKLSTHYQRNMTCSVCHNPHNTRGPENIESTMADASGLCTNCHKDFMKDFPNSSHASGNVTCVNCHLGISPEVEEPTSFEEIHKTPDHSFIAKISTCSNCHSQQMHAAGAATAVTVGAVVEPTAEVVAAETPETNTAPVMEKPAPVSPIGFAGMAGLLGLAAGMVLAPWLERAYQNYVKRGKND